MGIRITCIKKDNGNHENPCEAITALGWINDQNGNVGKSTRKAMYDWINQGNYAYIQDGVNKIKLITSESSKGNPYVKTIPNDTKNDNLLAQPECG